MASAAYQQAAAYAKDRLQGRSADGSREPVAIIEHADVRRMLLTIRSFVEAGRALAGWAALQSDRFRHHPGAAERSRAGSLVTLLTPVIKAVFTDMGFESAVQAQQVFGGHGYIREWGMEQYVRDARSAQIYEGTNGVQAMDLVSRKLPLKGGAVASEFFATIAADLEAAVTVESARIVATATRDALDLLRRATLRLEGADMDVLGCAAVSYQRMFGIVAMGWMWTRMAQASHGVDTPVYQSKLHTARFFAEHVLPPTRGLASSIDAGAASIMAFDADAF